jgi:ferrochelatase
VETKVKNKILLLVNTGTPDSPHVKLVRKYLSEFLNDKRVIDLPWLLRKILVNIIIVPFRSPKSAVLYSRLWTDDGSPLKYNLYNLVNKVQCMVDNEYRVIGAMRYGSPSLRDTLRILEREIPEEIIVFPLYPHYASSTSGSVSEFIMNEIRTWNIVPNIRIMSQFYSNPSFIDAVADKIRKHDPDGFDHILFSYHSLPLRHLRKIHPETGCTLCNCNTEFPEYGSFCYRATCYETTKLLAEKLNLDHAKYSTSFQSRLSKNWLAPFTDTRLIELAHSGKRRVLVVAPSFAADCLETLIEIKEEYSKLFQKEGGEILVLAESLNDSDTWAEAIIRIAKLKI